MKQDMDKQEHLQYLKEKYIELSRQFLVELQNGKSIHMLRDLSAVINTLLKEIDEMEKTDDGKKKSSKA
jgi:hypothetical protein